MSAQWPHTIRIFSPENATPGSSTADGVFTPGFSGLPPTDLYNGKADVQDGGRMFDLNRDGQYSNVSDAVVFLAHVHAIDDIINKVDLQAEVTWANKTTSIATVVKVRRLDGTVWLKWL